MSPKKIKTFYSIGILLVIFISLSMVEITSHYLFINETNDVVSPNKKTEFEYDDYLGWKGIKGFKGKSKITNVDIEINAQGFRDEDFLKKLKHAERTGSKKILFLGDSVLYGFLIRKEDRISEQLKKVYSNQGEEVVTFNAGIPAFGTGQQLRVFEKLYSQLNPHIVILLFVKNDIADSSLPYDYRYLDRVYKPFYDFEGNLLFNNVVPKRFSLSLKNTFLDKFSFKRLIDKIQYLIDDLRYSSHGILENKRIKQEDGTYLTMEDLFHSKLYKDIFDANKIRNFNLIKKINEQVKNNNKRFIVLTNFGRNMRFLKGIANFTETESSHHTDILNFLDENSIEHSFFNKNFDLNYFPCYRVLIDGHPNYFWHYSAALDTYNFIEKKNVKPNYLQTEWHSKMPEKIDFEKADFPLYLYGNWYNIESLGDSKGRWIGGSAALAIKPPKQIGDIELVVEGGTHFGPGSKNNGQNSILNLKIINYKNETIANAEIPGTVNFKLRFKIGNVNKRKPLCLNLKPDKTIVPESDNRALSIYINKIYAKVKAEG
jgi:hypothetical protein